MDRTSGVISLRRLITDLRSNWPLFTRENYVCHDGLPYDYEAVMLKEFAERAAKGAFWASTTGPEAHGSSRMAHEQFDRLAGLDPAKRMRVDRLPKSLLDTIEGWLEDLIPHLVTGGSYRCQTSLNLLRLISRWNIRKKSPPSTKAGSAPPPGRMIAPELFEKPRRFQCDLPVMLMNV
jgi:hypothetical protein